MSNQKSQSIQRPWRCGYCGDAIRGRWQKLEESRPSKRWSHLQFSTKKGTRSRGKDSSMSDVGHGLGRVELHKMARGEIAELRMPRSAVASSAPVDNDALWGRDRIIAHGGCMMAADAVNGDEEWPGSRACGVHQLGAPTRVRAMSSRPSIGSLLEIGSCSPCCVC